VTGDWKIAPRSVAAAILLASAGCDAPLPGHPVTFELCLIAPDGTPGAVPRTVRGGSDTVLVLLPPLLSGADLDGVRAVTKSAWYVLSGRHSTSQVVLEVKPEALARWQEASRLAVSRGDRVALVLDGAVIGVILVRQVAVDREFAIDASFFSTGTEPEKARDATTLARQIRASLP
jgi:hypothetical protein